MASRKFVKAGIQADILAGAQQLAARKDGLSAKLSHAAVQILLHAEDGPQGTHSMVSTAFGAQLCASVQLNEWQTIPPPRLNNVLRDIPFIRTVRVPGLTHAVMVLDVEMLLAQAAAAHGPCTGSHKLTQQSTGQNPQQQGPSAPSPNGSSSTLRSSPPLMHTQRPVTPGHLAQMLPAAKAGSDSMPAAAAAAASGLPQPLPGTHTDAASFVLQLMAMAVFRPKSAEDHATHLRCFAACFLARYKDRHCPLPNSSDIKLLGALLNRAGSPEQQALMNYKPHIVHRGQKVQALATLDALHVLQLDPPEPAHPPHFVPAGAGNRQQRIVLCVEALQAAAQAAAGNVLGIGPLSILPSPSPTANPNPATSLAASAKRRTRTSVKCQLLVFDERAAEEGHATQAPPEEDSSRRPQQETQSSSVVATPPEAAPAAAAATAAVEEAEYPLGQPSVTSSVDKNVPNSTADPSKTDVALPVENATAATGAAASAVAAASPPTASPAASPAGPACTPSEARPVVLQIVVLEEEDGAGGDFVAGQPSAPAPATAPAPLATTHTLLPLEQEQTAHARAAAQLASARDGSGVVAGNEGDEDDLVQCPDLDTCVQEVYEAVADRATAQASNNSNNESGSNMPTARVADAVAVALLKQYVATHLLNVLSGPLGPHSITGPNLGLLLNKSPPTLLKLYESLPKPRMRSLLLHPVEDGPGGLTNYYDDGILRAVQHKDNLGVVLDVAALQDAWRKENVAAAIARNSSRLLSHPSTHPSHKAHARAAALSARAATNAPTALSDSKHFAFKAAAAAAAGTATANAAPALQKFVPVAGSAQSQPPPPPPAFDPSGGSHCPDLATCVHAVYAGDTLKRLLALSLCKRTHDQPHIGPFTSVGPDIGTMLSRNPESAPFYNALGTPKLRKLLEVKAPPGEGGGKGPNRPALAPDDGILCSVPFHGNQGVRLNVAALQEAYLKLHATRGKQHLANASSGTGFMSSSATTNATVASMPAFPAAAAAASLNASDSRGLAVCMACLSVWAKADSGGVYGFGSQAGVALASLAVTIICQWPHHATSNGGGNRYQLRHAARVIEKTLSMLSAEGWGGSGGQPRSSSVGPQLVSQVLQHGAPWLQVLDQEGLPVDLDALAIANLFAESGLFVELQVEALAQHVVDMLSSPALTSPTKDSVHTLMREKATGRLIAKPKPLSTSAAGWPPQLGAAPAQRVLKSLQQNAAGKARPRLRIVVAQLLEEAWKLQQQQQAKTTIMQDQAGTGSSGGGGALSPHAHVLGLCLEQLKAMASNSHNDVPLQMGVSSSGSGSSNIRSISGKPSLDQGVTLLQHTPHASASMKGKSTGQHIPTEHGALKGSAAPHQAAPTSTAAAAAAVRATGLSTQEGDVSTELHHHIPLEGSQDVDLGSETLAEQQQQQHWDAYSPTPQRARAALEARLAAQAQGFLAGMPMPQPVHDTALLSAAACGERVGQAQQQQQQQQGVQLGELEWGALDDAVDSGASGVVQHASGWVGSKMTQEAVYPHGGAAQPQHQFHNHDHLYIQQQHLEQQMLGIPPTSPSTLLPTCWQQEEGAPGWDAARMGAGGVPDPVPVGRDAHRMLPASPDIVPHESFSAEKPSAQQHHQQSGLAERGAGEEEDEGVNDDDLLALLVGGGVE